MVNHYSIQSMFRQKVRALALRSETQARDVFDLYFLIGSGNRFQLDKNTIIRHFLLKPSENWII